MSASISPIPIANAAQHPPCAICNDCGAGIYAGDQAVIRYECGQPCAWCEECSMARGYVFPEDD